MNKLYYAFLVYAWLSFSPIWAQEQIHVRKLLKVSQFPLPSAGQGEWVLSASPQWWLYMASSSGIIAQFDTLGSELRKASKSKWLEGSYLDAKAGVRLFLFSQEAQQAYWIDRLLGQSQEVVLGQEAFFSALAPSPNGGFWGFDTYTLSLLNLSLNGGSSVQHTIPLLGTALAKDQQDLQCRHIAVNHGRVYAFFEQGTLAVWSNTGAYLGKSSIPNLLGFDLSGNYLYAWTAEQLLQFQPENLAQPIRAWPLPKGNWKHWAISSPYIFGQNAQGISVFRME